MRRVCGPASTGRIMLQTTASEEALQIVLERGRVGAVAAADLGQIAELALQAGVVELAEIDGVRTGTVRGAGDAAEGLAVAADLAVGERDGLVPVARDTSTGVGKARDARE